MSEFVERGYGTASPFPSGEGLGWGVSSEPPPRPDSPHPSIPSPEREGKIASRFSLADIAQHAGFRTDLRFASKADLPPPPPEPEPDPGDPVAEAFAEGFAAGLSKAEAEAAARAEADADARDALALSFARLDAELGEQLRLRLRDTVAALCEAAIAPLALDERALEHRIARAVSMLSRADDERVIRLHPDDLALVSERLSEEWRVSPDPSLPRGAIRVETATGGVEDGPEQWRRAIAEALHQC